MTIDEMMRELVKLQEAGKGDYKVLAYPAKNHKYPLPKAVSKSSLVTVTDLGVLLIGPEEN